MNLLWLGVIFFLTSLVYSSVGFAGGSTYTAVLLSVLDNRSVALFVSLFCNAFVASISLFFYWRNNLIIYSAVIPIVLFSSVGSYIGASLTLSKTLFSQIFASVLLLNSLFLLFDVKFKSKEKNQEQPQGRKIFYFMYGPLSFSLGLLAGITSIGGGILLAPFLHLYSALKTKNIMAISSFFIFVNSVIGLVARRDTLFEYTGEVGHYSALLVCVAIGGVLGSNLGIRRFNALYIKRLTGVLLLILSIRFLIKSFQ